jgi:hypothetical protein
VHVFVLLAGGFLTGERAAACCVGIALGPQSAAPRTLDGESKSKTYHNY